MTTSGDSDSGFVVSCADKKSDREGLRYVLITPARNEAAFIELTIESVVTQTAKPIKWVIVSDGSTDDTDKIVKRYAAQHPWIELVRMPERKERTFAGKVHAFNAGYARIQDLEYDIIGNLDADITFASDYFEFLLGRFSANPRLGVTGTPFQENGATYNYRFASIEHVSGACQLFRRECFNDIGGYKPIEGGGIDLVAVLTARMSGWGTRSYLERVCNHHRIQGSANHSGLQAKYKVGEKDYRLGAHPLWELLRCAYRMITPPYLIGGGIQLLGYISAFVRRAERAMPMDLIVFRRREQMARLKQILFKR